MTSLDFFVALATWKRWKIFHFDVKLAFLNRMLEKYIYIKYPKGFMVVENQDKVLKLNKALNGLK